MAILKAVSVSSLGHKHANLSGIIKYVLKDEKTEEKLVYGQCLDVPTAYKQMIETKETWHKEGGVEYFHLIQSFPPNENITPEQALEQAKKFLEGTEKFWGHEILVAVHKDREHIHSHFIINSVNFATGKKFHLSKKELEELKQLQNNINIRDGFLPAPEKYKGMDNKPRTEKVINDKDTYQLVDKAEKGQKESYILNCALSLLNAKQKATSKNELIAMMKESGFYTEWSDSKKHITFTDIKRKEQGEKKCKIRLQTLANYYPEFAYTNTKETLENELSSNSERIRKERLEFEYSNIRDTNRTIDAEREELTNRKIKNANRRAEIRNSRAEQSNRRGQKTSSKERGASRSRERKEQSASRENEGYSR